MKDFVHLHLHTDYSLLDGCGRISDYIKKAKEFGMKAIAITDHGNMFGTLSFYKECKDNGINGIVGSEFYVSPEDVSIKDDTNRLRYHLILLAKNETGFKNLIKMSSLSYTEGFYNKPRIDKKILQEHSDGLVCLSACLAGEIPQLLLSSDEKKAEESALWFQNVFGKNNYYIEIQNHGIKEEIEVLPKLIKLAKKLNIPLVATNDCHYVNKDDAEAQDVLMCIGMGKMVSDTARLKFSTDELYFKSPEEMSELFKDYPEAISNSIKIADMCSLNIELPGPIPPHFIIDENEKWTKEYLDKLNFTLKKGAKDKYKLGTISKDDIEEASLLSYKANIGLKERYEDVSKEEFESLKARLDYELNVIISMGFSGYFLIVADYVNWSKNNGVSVGPGRGSGAGSIVAYSLKITDVDPIKYGLVFERFLNPERISMPDFDIDFCTDNRYKTIEYVTEKYGKDNVGQICTFGKLGVKNCIRDVCRVLEIPLFESDDMASAIPDDYKGDWNGVLNGYTTKEGAVFPVNQKIKEYISRGGVYEKLSSIIPKIEGMVRNIGLHAAGLIIASSGLSSFVPLYREPKKGIVASQYEMTEIEECGLVKMDFLGLKTLTLIEHTISFIRKKDPNFKIENIDEKDKKTFRLFADANTHGVFQFESGGMRKTLKQCKPESISELAALNALYRPGPMDNIGSYIEGKYHPDKINYHFDELKDLLFETFGVIVYQEQVMNAARIFANYTMGEADNLRKIMGKKKKELLPKEKEKFIKASVSNGKKEKDAAALFELLEPFAGYGFNKSHAVCYAVIAYQTAYLKANYPVEFMAAMLIMEAQGANTDKFKEYLNLSKEQKINIVAPDVNKSQLSFYPVGKEIVYGLEGLKGMGRNTAYAIIEERETNGDYTSFYNFLERNIGAGKVNSAAVTSLINAGAFDSLHSNRAELILNLEKGIDQVSRLQKDEKFGQQDLFADEEVSSKNFTIDKRDEFSRRELLEREKESIGCYLSGHPLDDYKTLIDNRVGYFLSEKQNFAPKTDVHIIVLIEDVEVKLTKQGAEFAKIILSDYSAVTDVICWNNVWVKEKSKIEKGKVVCVVLQKNGKEGDDTLVLKSVLEPEKMPSTKTRYINIDIMPKIDRNDLLELKNILSASGGDIKVSISYQENGVTKKVVLGDNYKISKNQETIEEIKNCRIVKKVSWN